MKTKYVYNGLISLYVNFHNNWTMWSTNLLVKICRWGGGGEGKRAKGSITTLDFNLYMKFCGKNLFVDVLEEQFKQSMYIAENLFIVSDNSTGEKVKENEEARMSMQVAPDKLFGLLLILQRRCSPKQERLWKRKEKSY